MPVPWRSQALGVLEQKCQVQSDTLAARERELDRARKLIEDLTARVCARRWAWACLRSGLSSGKPCIL
jgi:hypothetical protein